MKKIAVLLLFPLLAAAVVLENDTGVPQSMGVTPAGTRMDISIAAAPDTVIILCLAYNSPQQISSVRLDLSNPANLSLLGFAGSGALTVEIWGTTIAMPDAENTAFVIKSSGNIDYVLGKGYQLSAATFGTPSASSAFDMIGANPSVWYNNPPDGSFWVDAGIQDGNAEGLTHTGDATTSSEYAESGDGSFVAGFAYTSNYQRPPEPAPTPFVLAGYQNENEPANPGGVVGSLIIPIPEPQNFAMLLIGVFMVAVTLIRKRA